MFGCGTCLNLKTELMVEWCIYVGTFPLTILIELSILIRFFWTQDESWTTDCFEYDFARFVILTYTWLPLFCLWKARVTDPGRLKTPENENAETKQLALMKSFETCQKCEAKRFERAHHCKRCNACILMMDHHCIFINGCVGRHNLKFFV